MTTMHQPHFFLGRVRVDALPWRDVRVSQVALLLAFSLVGHLVLHFTVSVIQALCAVAGAVLAEELAYVRGRQRLVVPASALITGLSLGLLLRSPHVWPFVVASLVAIASKYAVRARGRHLFNPSNFGLVVALAMVPGTSVAPGQWGSSWTLLFFLANCGLFMLYQVHRFHLVAAFLGTVALAGAGVAVAQHGSVAAEWHRLLSASLLLFAFFMLTDPRTSPGTLPGRLTYGALTGLLGMVLVIVHAPAPFFLALFGMCPLGALLDYWQQAPTFEWVMLWRHERVAHTADSGVSAIDSVPPASPGARRGGR